METESSYLLLNGIYTQFNYLFLTGGNPSVSSLIVAGLVIVVLLLCSGLLSGSEVAYFSITNQDIANLKKNNTPPKKRILQLLDRPRYLLSTILIANNFVNVGIIISSNSLLSTLIPETLFPPNLVWIHFCITVILVTFLLVLFGEVAPKVYANFNNMRIATLMSSPLLFLRTIFKPLSWFLVSSTQILEKRLRARLQSGGHNVVSQEDIAQAIELTVKNGKYASQDVNILKRIVKFGNISAKNIMRSRVDVIAVDSHASFFQLLNVFKENSYSRIPVYDETFDKILGVLHSKDLLDYLNEGPNFDWHMLMRTPFFVPENKKIDDLFEDFQVKRTHMAIVVDEYGGTSGIVTLEDVLEEIVGEIHDEFDGQQDLGYTKINDYNYIFDGRTSIYEVCKITNIRSAIFEEKRSGAETIAGFLLVLNGTIPKKNTELTFNGITFIVLASTNRRIKTIKLILPQAAAQDNIS